MSCPPPPRIILGISYARLTLIGESDHITELNNTTPKQPFFFLKPASAILCPGEGPVLRPKGTNLHYEVELALVMGKTLRDHDPNDEQGALDAIHSQSLELGGSFIFSKDNSKTFLDG